RCRAAGRKDRRRRRRHRCRGWFPPVPRVGALLLRRNARYELQRDGPDLDAGPRQEQRGSRHGAAARWKDRRRRLGVELGGNNGVVLGPKGVARAVAVQPDGKIVIGGDGFVVSRYNANGTPDAGFGTNVGRSPSPTTEAHALGLQRDGKIIVAGFSTDSGYGVVARYDSDGTLDTT